nr:flagellar export chaperone FliS [Gammaproteobacteria bacterium]
MMVLSNTRNALHQYEKVGVQSEVENASPHRLVQMLMEGAAARIAAAMGHLARGAIAEKGRSISLAISIIEGLRSSLDKDKGGQIANNLDQIYDYMSRRLLEANLKNDRAMLNEVQNLLRQIKEGWDAVAGGAADGDASRPRSAPPTTVQVTG